MQSMDAYGLPIMRLNSDNNVDDGLVLAHSKPVVTDDKEALRTLQDKYDRLLHQFSTLQKTNQELEDRLLNVVEKTEREKIILSDEIDEISSRLIVTSNNVTRLESECARYKKDCVLAVHMLQCKPSGYVSQRLGTNPVHKSAYEAASGSSMDPKASAENQRKVVHVPSSFPPMAIFYNNEEEEEKPEDPRHSMMESEDKSAAQEAFIEKIRTTSDYKCSFIRQCSHCGTTISTIDKATQTEKSRILATSQSEANLRGRQWLRSLSSENEA